MGHELVLMPHAILPNRYPLQAYSQERITEMSNEFKTKKTGQYRLERSRR